ncbi:hypothetical protein FRB91_010773 [Serendipita sp. 411]|nr:hypothetical protein FRB91_010773 [Serendipita sp. 411]
MATIDAIARNHLRLPNNAPVPDSYVLVLEKFLKAYPDDLNFIIQHAFSGSVLKCLEVGCEGVALNMGRQSGQSAGCIATLEPYKQHIRTHPTHTISRNNRIRRKSGPNMDMRGSVAPGRVRVIILWNLVSMFPRIKNFLEHYDQESFGGQKTVQDGLFALNLPELGATLPGMQTALLAHQVIGVSWMLQREREDAKWARGGILADAMGLGKTVQSIGVICANPSTDPGCAATLIVAPLALLEQWKQEISWKCEEGTFNVLIYHGPNRPKNKHEIMKYDIVLTTYHTLGNEWETEKKTRKGKKSDEGSVNDEGTEDRTTKKRKVGPLMDIHWYRVILDEAQFIRNPRTKASSIVTHLIADIKWCLTGTPFTNGLKDVFGFLRFIEHNPFADWDRFRGLIRGHEDERAAKNVQQALAGVLFRRTKESKLDGKPIIMLPPRNESWHTLEFQPEERQIYDFVEKKLQAVFNRFLQAGTVLKNYSEVA